MVVCNHVSNVFGFIQPVYEIAEMCSRFGVPLVIDASQSAGIEDLDAERLNADFIAMPGHKGLLGPQGTGILLCKTLPAPLMSGGTGSESIIQSMPDYLPDRAEAGTHNVVGISGLCEGIKYVLGKGVNKIGSYEAELCGTAAERLSRAPSLEVFRGKAGVQAGVLSFRHTSIDCENFCEKLGSRGIAARWRPALRAACTQYRGNRQNRHCTHQLFAVYAAPPGNSCLHRHRKDSKRRNLINI